MTANFVEATREALEFLRSHNKVGMIATVDAGGQPYLSPVYFTMGNGFDLYFITAKVTHKARNIEVNDRVAFSVGTGPEYISLMIRGRASVPSGEEESRALANMVAMLENAEASQWPVKTLDDLKDQRLVLYKITPEKVTFLNINSSQEPKSNTDHLYYLMD